jgi:heat shock protein HtpX
VVEEMSIASGLPMPKVYIIEDSAPNAFATGRSPQTASIAVTRGLLDKMNRDELQGVVAHEMGHVLNRDILFVMMAGILVGVLVLICDFYLRGFWRAGGRRTSSKRGGGQGILILIAIILAILAPIIARLLYLAISRRREYLADATSAALTRYPEGLASALEKIANDPEVLEVANRATSPLYIVNPIKPFEERYCAWASTHPPIGERIKILRSIAGTANYLAYQNAWRQVGERSLGARLISPAEMAQSNTRFQPRAEPVQGQAGSPPPPPAQPSSQP